MKRIIIYIVCMFTTTAAMCQTYVLANNEEVQGNAIKKVYKKGSRKQTYDFDSFKEYLNTAFKSYFNNPRVKAPDDKATLEETKKSLETMKSKLEEEKSGLEKTINDNTGKDSQAKNTRLEQGIEKVKNEVEPEKDALCLSIASLSNEVDSLKRVLAEFDDKIELNRPFDEIVASAEQLERDLKAKIEAEDKISGQMDNINRQIDCIKDNIDSLASGISRASFDDMLSNENIINQTEGKLKGYEALMISCGKESIYNELNGELTEMRKYLNLANRINEAKKFLSGKYSSEKNNTMLQLLSDPALVGLDLNPDQQDELKKVKEALTKQQDAIDNAKKIAGYIKDNIGCIYEGNRESVLEYIEKNKHDYGSYNVSYNNFINRLKDNVTNYVDKWDDDLIVSDDLDKMIKDLSE